MTKEERRISKNYISNKLLVYISKEYLYTEYIINCKTMKQIGKLFNIGYSTIRRLLLNYNINIKTPADYQKGITLKQYYCKDCGEKIGLNSGLYGRSICFSCFRKSQIGENASNWQGGKSFEPYSSEFNNSLKNKIRDRDNHECQLCHTKEKYFDRKLSIHHINYNKENCKKENLISLCISCNSQVNANRNYYTEYFKNLILQLI